MNRTRRTALILVLLNVLWSFHPLYGKLLLSEVAPMQGAWLRYAASWIAWALAFLLLRARLPAARLKDSVSGVRRRLVGMGMLTFFLAPLLQLEGLSRSHASDNAILVAMEPLLAVALAWAFLKEQPTRWQLPGFLAACAGVYLISGGSDADASLSAGLLLGNLLIVASMLGEASYSVLGKALVGRVDPLRGFGVAAGAGAAGLAAASVLRGSPLLPGEHSAGFWLALLALGPLGTTAGYLAWWYLLRDVPVRLAALSLFLQPLAGAFWGSVFLQDPWNAGRVAGAALVLLGVLVVVQSELDKSPVSAVGAADAES